MIIDDQTRALWRTIQTFLGPAAGKPDGLPGWKTANAVADALHARATGETAPADPGQRFDERSERNIATLRPEAQRKAREWMRECLDEGINLRIIAGTRTFAEQDRLYAQGRTAPGPKVTNARAGQSWHNFGVAWDFVVFDAAGQPQWDHPGMDRAGEIGEALGLEWGGRWKFVDKPHLQVRTGMSIADAIRKWPNGHVPD